MVALELKIQLEFIIECPNNLIVPGYFKQLQLPDKV